MTEISSFMMNKNSCNIQRHDCLNVMKEIIKIINNLWKVRFYSIHRLAKHLWTSSFKIFHECVFINHLTLLRLIQIHIMKFWYSVRIAVIRFLNVVKNLVWKHVKESEILKCKRYWCFLRYHRHSSWVMFRF